MILKYNSPFQKILSILEKMLFKIENINGDSLTCYRFGSFGIVATLWQSQMSSFS